MNRIKCNVSSCKFNEEGKVCNASEIKVDNNYGCSNDMEIGAIGETKNAKTSVETCCQTFAPK